MTLLPHITVDHGPEREKGPLCSVVWLHGLGADGHDFESLLPHLGLAADLSVRFIFPHADIRPVTLNGGMAMRAWYDIVSLDRSHRDDSGIRQSSRQIEALIDQELLRGVPSERILLAGFSQGGAMVLQVGLRYERCLMGLLVLSAYLLDDSGLDAALVNKQTPILQCHGDYDPIVPVALGEQSCRRIQELGFACEWRTYPVQHGLDPEEVNDIAGWLTSRLRSADSS